MNAAPLNDAKMDGFALRPSACPTMSSTPNVAPFFIAKVGDDGTQVDAWPDQPLLTSLEQGGVDWPSSCRNGTCRTCIGFLSKGEVRYEIEWPGLSPEEKAEGWVLPCCAYPLTDLQIENSSI